MPVGGGAARSRAGVRPDPHSGGVLGGGERPYAGYWARSPGPAAVAGGAEQCQVVGRWSDGWCRGKFSGLAWAAHLPLADFDFLAGGGWSCLDMACGPTKAGGRKDCAHTPLAARMFQLLDRCVVDAKAEYARKRAAGLLAGGTPVAERFGLASARSPFAFRAPSPSAPLLPLTWQLTRAALEQQWAFSSPSTTIARPVCLPLSSTFLCGASHGTDGRDRGRGGLEVVDTSDQDDEPCQQWLG